MKQFLHETWELWYWALFCPSKLQQRLNEWVPPETLPTDEPPEADHEGEKAAQKNGEEQGKPPPNTSFLDILWFRASGAPGSNRLLAQFALAVALSTLPLVASMLALGRPRDLPLAGIALLASFGIGALCSSLGLIAPFLFVLIYLIEPSLARAGLDQAADQLPPLRRLGVGLGAGAAILGLTAAAVEALWRRDRLVLGRAMLLSGTWLGLVGAGWLATGSTEYTGIVGGLIGLCLLIFRDDKAFHGKDMDVFTGSTAAGVALLTAFSLLGKLDFGITSGISNFALMGALALPAVGATGFLVHGIARVFSKSVAGSMVGVVLGGLLGGALFPTASGFFAALAKVSFFPWLILSWAIGFGLAPTRAGTFTFVDLARAYAEEGWLNLRYLPFAILEHRPTMAFLLGIAWPVALRIPYGWPALLAVPAVLLGYYRVLPDSLVFASMSFFRATSLDRRPRAAPIHWLHSMPPYRGELLSLPLPGHARILAAGFRADPAAALEVMQQMLVSDFAGRDRVFDKAEPAIERTCEALGDKERSRLLTARLQAMSSVEDFVTVADRADVWLHLFAPDPDHSPEGESPTEEEKTDEDTDIAKLFPAFQNIARDVEVATKQDLAFQREQGLVRCLADIDRLRNELPALGLDAELTSGWRGVLDRWQTVLEGAIDTQTIEAQRAEIVQPFQSGNPLRADRAHLFKGRQPLADALVRQVLDRSRPTLVLHGPRRCGKSSFLLNLSRLLPDSLVPVYMDLQSQAMTSSEGDFCYGLVRAALRDLRSQGLAPPVGDRVTFRASPYPALEDWLDEVRPLLGSRRLLLCLDEFEKLGAAITSGTITLSLFDELRHLIQHRDELSFIFCGMQTLEELGPSWSSYFINARPIEMLYLEPEEARDLLRNPDPFFDLRYDPEIVEQVLEITSCQPYLLQLIGEAMVKAANRHHVRHVNQLLLEEALEDALTAGEIYFSNIWDETTGAAPEEVAAGRDLLRALASERSLPPLNEVSGAALRRLSRYHVVRERDGQRIEVPLVARWVRERKGLFQ